MKWYNRTTKAESNVGGRAVEQVLVVPACMVCRSVDTRNGAMVERENLDGSSSGVRIDPN